MGEISPDLQQLLDKAGPGVSGPLKLIVTLSRDSEWRHAVEAVKAAGLRVAREEPAIRALFGESLADDIPRIATLPEVELVESEGVATAL